MREKLAEAVNEETFRQEFLNELRPELADRIPPDLWKLHWSLMTPQRREIATGLLALKVASLVRLGRIGLPIPAR